MLVGSSSSTKRFALYRLATSLVLVALQFKEQAVKLSWQSGTGRTFIPAEEQLVNLDKFSSSIQSFLQTNKPYLAHSCFRFVALQS